MEYVRLNNGKKMPILGFGVYQIPSHETERAVSEAIEIGYRHFDTAQLYRNERGVGEAINKSGIARNDFFITTKLSTSGYKETKKQINQALTYLQTESIDLMFIHWLIPDYMGTYRALEEAYCEGKVQAIGLSNFNQQQIKTVIQQADIKPVILQNEMQYCISVNHYASFAKRINYNLNRGLRLVKEWQICSKIRHYKKLERIIIKQLLKSF